MEHYTIPITELIGKTITQINCDYYENEIIFTCDSGEKYKMTHYQDCCESVVIDDVNGDWGDLIGVPILKAEEVDNYEPITEEDIIKTKDRNDWGSCTWTFYKFATINGYYSERVDFIKIENE